MTTAICAFALWGAFPMFGEGATASPDFVLIGEPAPSRAAAVVDARTDFVVRPTASVELGRRSPGWGAGYFRGQRCARGRCARW